MNGTKVTDRGIAEAARHCRGLEMLALSRTKLSDEGCAAVARYCEGLRVLGINSSHDVTDNALVLGELMAHHPIAI